MRSLLKLLTTFQMHCSLVSCEHTSTSVNITLKRCIGCLTVRYCCAAHQASDWVRHKLDCAPSRTRVRHQIKEHRARIQHTIDRADPLVQYLDVTTMVMKALRPFRTTPPLYSDHESTSPRSTRAYASQEVLLDLQTQLFMSSFNNNAKLIYGFTNNYYTRRFFALFNCTLKHDYVLWTVGNDLSSLKQTHGIKMFEHRALCSLMAQC